MNQVNDACPHCTGMDSQRSETLSVDWLFIADVLLVILVSDMTAGWRRLQLLPHILKALDQIPGPDKGTRSVTG